MTRTPAAVIIGDHTQGLGIARSAALAGADVWVLNDRYVSLARFSRHVVGYRRLDWGTLEQLERPAAAEHLRSALLELPFKDHAVLFGVNEDIIRFIHENRATLRTRYIVPEARLEAAYDKFRFNEILPEPVRIHTRLCSETDLDALVEPGGFLLKGRCGNAFRRITGRKALPVNRLTRSDRNTLFARLAPDQILIQQIIETARPVVSVCTFSVKGGIKAFFGYEKLRQQPKSFGTGSYLRSVAVDDFLPLAEFVLKGVEFTGVSEIEFIHDQKSGTYRIIEMNPRPWKSVHFATQCGENLIARYLLYLAGQTTDSRGGFVKGQYWVDLASDLLRMVREKRIARYDRGVFECVWERHDPLPAVILWTLFPIIAFETAYHRLRTVSWLDCMAPRKLNWVTRKLPRAKSFHGEP